MRKLQNIIVAFFTLLSFSSCEKIIDIEINESEKKYVIEGNISNIVGERAEVKISQTKSFEDNNNFKGVSGAVVTIQVNSSTIYTLPETSTGVYTTTAFTGTPGNSYKLLVNINGNSFISNCKMPQQIVRLDTLTKDNLSLGGSTTISIAPNYNDPVGLGNSYRFIEYANGVQVKKVFVSNDNIGDGLRSSRPLINNDSDLKVGDVVKVDMLCIDPAVYTYWYSLDQAATGNSTATPANPVSNFSGGCLGYFSAHSVTSKTIVL